MSLHPPSSFVRAGLLVAAFLLFAGRSAAQERWQLETREHQRVEMELVVEVEAPRPWRGEILLVMAKAPDMPRQRRVSTVLKPAATAATDSSPLKRPVLVSRTAGLPGPRRFSLTVKYQATLMSSRLVAVPRGARLPAATALTDGERKAYLRTGTACNFKAKTVQAWLDEHQLRRKEDESDLDFARRAHLEIGKALQYRFPAGHDGKCSTVCTAGKGDCGSLSVVFVSALRANHIPARTVVGGRLNPGKPDERGGPPPYDYHVAAEFYADGIGWVPVDPASNVGRSAELRLASFGQDEGRFFTQHIDPDVSVTLPRKGVLSLSVLQQPGRWFWGPGPWKDIEFREKWTVRKLPLEERPGNKEKKEAD